MHCEEEFYTSKENYLIEIEVAEHIFEMGNGRCVYDYWQFCEDLTLNNGSTTRHCQKK